MKLKLKFRDGLIPVVVSDEMGNILMLAYANTEALSLTLKTKRSHFFSRERNKIWMKGETSGNYQTVKDVYADCDGDAVLYIVNQTGTACHTGNYSCFFHRIKSINAEEIETEEQENKNSTSILFELEKVIQQRLNDKSDESYTYKLVSTNTVKDKIIEEAGELCEASTQNEIIWESADLIYHIMVLLGANKVNLSDVMKELQKRRKR